MVNHAPPELLRGSGRGAYALILRLDSHSRLLIGKLGSFDFRPGYYIYVGSALGAGGLAGRLKHHLMPVRKTHWHIDYLRQAARLEEVWFVESDTWREHAWASVLRAMPGAASPVPRFGASDCRCASHLFYFTDVPSGYDFRERVVRTFPGDSPIQQYRVAEAWR